MTDSPCAHDFIPALYVPIEAGDVFLAGLQMFSSSPKHEGMKCRKCGRIYDAEGAPITRAVLFFTGQTQ